MQGAVYVSCLCVWTFRHRGLCVFTHQNPVLHYACFFYFLFFIQTNPRKLLPRKTRRRRLSFVRHREFQSCDAFMGLSPIMMDVDLILRQIHMCNAEFMQNSKTPNAPGCFLSPGLCLNKPPKQLILEDSLQKNQL